MNGIEKIGNVSLDLTYYPGEDFYSEGAGEDVLLELVKKYGSDRYNQIISEHPGWSTLYHLSDLRGNIVDFLPFNKKDKVLEVGAGCGAITGTIAKKAGSVTCVELSKKRSLINANRNKDCDNVNIMVGNFQTIEEHLDKDFDYIMLIGVFEYAASYIKDNDPYGRFLSILLSHLKEGGRLVIAIENKYGLKYWAGCKEDHLGTFYSSLTGYGADSPVKTFSRDALINQAKKAGCSVYEYYPYPDYKLPVTVYSEKRLPMRGELYAEVPNFDNDRIVAFDEGKVFDELIEEGKFPFFSNSFLFVLKKGDGGSDEKEILPVYSKHSNERAALFAIRTDIELTPEGKRQVVKYPLTAAAAEHVDSFKRKYELLKTEYADSVFEPNKYCQMEGEGSENGAKFEFIGGDNLQDVIINHLTAGEKAEAFSIIDKFVNAVRQLPATNGFEADAEFKRMFGDAADRLSSTLPCFKVADIDLIFPNIMSANDKWIVVDYEWTFECSIPVDFVIFRALWYLSKECAALDTLFENDGEALLKKYGISAEMYEVYVKLENSFQKYISGNRLSLLGFHSIFGRDRYKTETLMTRSVLLPRLDRARVFYKMGKDYQAAFSDFVLTKELPGDVHSLDVFLPEGGTGIRLDPTEEPCMVKFVSAPSKEALINGDEIGDGVLFFSGDDPMVMFDDIEGGRSYHFEYIVTPVRRDFYAPLCRKMQEIKELDRLRSEKAALENRGLVDRVLNKKPEAASGGESVDSLVKIL